MIEMNVDTEAVKCYSAYVFLPIYLNFIYRVIYDLYCSCVFR